MRGYEPPPTNAKGDQLFPAPVSFWDQFDIAMVRAHPKFVKPIQPGPKLHLGAGRKMINGNGWVNIDWPTWNAEDDFTEDWRLPAADDSVAAIACYHTLDHIEPWAVVRAVAEFQRVLRPGCAATIVVPHFMGTLWNECLMHKSRFAVDTWRNLFSERQYDRSVDGQYAWRLDIGINMIFGLNERNLVLFTQLVKRGAE